MNQAHAGSRHRSGSGAARRQHGPESDGKPLPSRAAMRARLGTYFFLGAFGFLLYEGLRLLRPFAGALVFAMTVGLLVYPMHARLRRWFPRVSSGLAAFATSGIVFLFFLIPLGLFGWALVSEANALLPEAKVWSQQAVAWVKAHPPETVPVIRRLPSRIRSRLDLRSLTVQGRLETLAERALGRVTSGGAAFAKHAFALVLGSLVFLLSLFFIFRDGEALSTRALGLLPFDPRSREVVRGRLTSTVTGVVRGILLTCLAQGVTAGIGFLIVGAQGVLLLAAMTALASLIPSVGTALVWAPVAGLYFLSGHYLKGAFLAAWGVLVVGVIDNLARPYLVGAGSDMPFLFLFFALLGGIEVFGILGIVVGPLVFGLIAAFIQIYEERYGASGA